MAIASTISSSVTFEGADTLCLAPGQALAMRATLPQPATLAAMIRLPAAVPGSAEISFWISDAGREIPGTRFTNAGLTEPAWQPLGPIPLAAGPLDLGWTSAAADGAWPAGVEPVHVGKAEIGGTPVSLALWCGLGGGDPAGRAVSAMSLDDPAPTTYFTSFEETGPLYFLRYISWLDWAALDWITFVRQSSDQALNGTQSAQFVQVPPFGGSILWSRELPIPPASKELVISFGCYATRTDTKIAYRTYYDGTLKSDLAETVDRSDAWYRVLINETIPAGAQKLKFEIFLAPLPNAPLDNAFFMDDLLVELVGPAAAAPARAVIFGDVTGGVYGVSNVDGTRLWRQDLPRGCMGAPATIAGGIAYITGNGSPGVVQARNPQTGALVWTTDIAAPVDSAAALWRDRVYVGAENGHLYGLATSGAGRGTIVYDEVMFAVPAGGATLFATTIVDGIAYVTSTLGLHAFDIAAESLVWTHAAANAVTMPPAVGEAVVYVARADGLVEALNRSDGSAVFPAKSLGAAINSQPQLVGGMVIAGTDGGVLVALDGLTGATLWTINASGPVRGFLLSHDRVYVASSAISGNMSAFTFQVGDQGTWSFAPAWQVAVTLGLADAPLINDQLILYTGGDRQLHAVRARDGTILWAAAADAAVFVSPVVDEAPLDADLTRRYDQKCWLCTHNAYANTSDGWLYAQQSCSITEQLNDGVRALMLDVGITRCEWRFDFDHPAAAARVCGTGVTAAPDIYLIHENLTTTAAAMFPRSFASLRKFSAVLAEIKAWMGANPAQIVTIFLESQVNDPALMQQAIQAGGVADLIFWADRANTGAAGNWTVATQGWPTLEWMVNANKRLVLLSQRRSGADGVPNVYQYAVETQYGDAGIAPGCNKRSESNALNDLTRKLFILDYFVTGSIAHAVWWPGHYGSQNDYFSIIAKVNECSPIAGRLPNFIAVDFYQRGDHGGPKAVVDWVDARWKAVPP
ncbi:MAG: hypothetical protein QOC65_27 [Sphingomonadales bacterium]|nr:hypothetical protein [Sphingomonadales bacterium]